MGTPKSLLQDLKDSKPPAAPTYKATSLERHQEARSKPGGGEETSLFPLPLTPSNFRGPMVWAQD